MNDVIQTILHQCNQVILGKEHQVRLSLACLLSGGHLLIEDIPGTGKTTLANTLAQSVGIAFQRVQFTSDMLPSDVLGVSIYDKNTKSFEFKPGAVFTHVLLADEINRASPKAQSALLEAMEERQVTVDGNTHPLPNPGFCHRHPKPTLPQRNLCFTRVATRPIFNADKSRLPRQKCRARSVARQRWSIGEC